MSKAIINTSVVVNLELSVDEATYLKGILQNPMIDDETTEDSIIRRAIFESLPSSNEIKGICVGN